MTHLRERTEHEGRADAGMLPASESQLNLRDEAPPVPTVAPTQTVAVACESTCCLPPALAAHWGIDIIPIPFVFGDHTFLDGVDITPAQFYARLAASPAPPKTSPPAPGEYLRAWRRLTERAESVVMVTPAGRLTTFGRSTRLACDLAPEVLPGTGIAVVDSGSAGMGQGFVALAAARAVRAGQPLDAVVRAAESVARRMRLLVTLDTLDYLARASRIPQVAAFVGGVLAIKPILLLAEGEIRQLARVRTRRRSIAQLIEQMRARVPADAPVHVAVQHTQAEAEARALEAELAREFHCVDLTTTEFTPVMGAYCGPGLLGIAYYEDAGEGETKDDTGTSAP